MPFPEVDVPKTLDSEHERMGEKLQTLHGKAFDDRYTHDMVQDHNKAVKLFQQEERSGSQHRAEAIRAEDLADARGAPEDGARVIAHALADCRPITAEPP